MSAQPDKDQILRHPASCAIASSPRILQPRSLVQEASKRGLDINMLREIAVGETSQTAKHGVFWVSQKQNDFVLGTRENGRIIKTMLRLQMAERRLFRKRWYLRFNLV